MSNLIFDSFNGLGIVEFQFTDKEISALKKSDIYSVFSRPEYSGNLSAIKDALNVVSSDIDKFQGDVASSIAMIDYNRSLIRESFNDATETESDMSDLLAVWPVQQPAMGEARLVQGEATTSSPDKYPRALELSGGINGIHNSYMEFTGQASEMLYRMDQMSRRQSYLNSQNNELLQSRTFINECIAVITQIQGA